MQPFGAEAETRCAEAEVLLLLLLPTQAGRPPAGAGWLPAGVLQHEQAEGAAGEPQRGHHRLPDRWVRGASPLGGGVSLGLCPLCCRSLACHGNLGRSEQGGTPRIWDHQHLPPPPRLCHLHSVNCSQSIPHRQVGAWARKPTGKAWKECCHSHSPALPPQQKVFGGRLPLRLEAPFRSQQEGNYRR